MSNLEWGNFNIKFRKSGFNLKSGDVLNSGNWDIFQGYFPVLNDLELNL